MLKLSNFDLRTALRLYAVTDNTWLGTQTLAQQVEAALAGGITMLQLREKQLAEAAFLKEAYAIKRLTERYHVPLIINDNLTVAIKSNADGLHIGQEDCSAARARRALGAGKILGVSAQTVEQALAAEAAGADYLGVGAIYATATKTDAAVVSIDTLAAICQSVKIPVVAIGGLNEDNITPLLSTGICGAAFVSAIFAANDITSAARRLAELLRF